MGARVKIIPDEMLVAGGVHDLDPELLITTAQAAMLLGCAVSGMAERKRSGRPPPPRQPDGRGTKVSYVLGEVLAARRSKPALSNAAAREAQKDHIRGFETFASFLAGAHLSDHWPFAIVDGRPVDFIVTLMTPTLLVETCKWLTLGQYLDRLKSAAAKTEANAATHAMEVRTPKAIAQRSCPIKRI